MFYQISMQLEESWKYKYSIFDEPGGVWKCGLRLSCGHSPAQSRTIPQNHHWTFCGSFIAYVSEKTVLFLFLPPIFPFCIVLHVHQTRSAVDQNCRLELCDVFLVRARAYHLLLNIFSCAVNIEKLAGTVLGKCRPSVFFAPTSLC